MARGINYTAGSLNRARKKKPSQTLTKPLIRGRPLIPRPEYQIAEDPVTSPSRAQDRFPRLPTDIDLPELFHLDRRRKQDVLSEQDTRRWIELKALQRRQREERERLRRRWWEREKDVSEIHTSRLEGKARARALAALVADPDLARLGCVRRRPQSSPSSSGSSSCAPARARITTSDHPNHRRSSIPSDSEPPSPPLAARSDDRTAYTYRANRDIDAQSVSQNPHSVASVQCDCLECNTADPLDRNYDEYESVDPACNCVECVGLGDERWDVQDEAPCDCEMCLDRIWSEEA